MTVLLLMAAAAAVTPVAPQSPVSEWGASSSQPGSVLFNLFVDPQGRPMSCEVVQVAGKDFSETVCNRVQSTTFRPARGSDGKIAYGFYQAVANFGGAGAGAGLKPIPDLSMTVKPGPSLKERRAIRVTAVIDAEGKVADCGAAAGAGDASLAKVACAQFKAQWSDAPLEDPQGTGRRYVRELTAEFVPEGTKP